jgi:histidine kinase
MRLRMIFRQLRWQIVAAQIVVVIVGVVTLTLTANWLAVRSVDPALLPAFRAAVGKALLVAALAATLAGLLAALLLMRRLLQPLRAIAASSRRIAAGHYAERVAVPASDELAALAESFNQMAAALEQVEAQRIALIGNVAHELRTPLASLEGYLEGLVDGVIPDDPASFATMQHEVRRLKRLVNDLQTLSRVEAGQIELHIAPCDLAALVERVVAQLQLQLIDSGLTITVQATSATVLADADRVAQIVLNLVGNAIRYTPAGGQITVRVDSDAAMARITVVDTGIGIPAEALPFLFERFYRVDPSRARTSGGSGIGLTIARHLAWAMGGELTAASPGPGQGSTFTLTFPLALP